MSTMKHWTKLSLTERNDLIGDRLGFKPATQCWIGYEGKRLLVTANDETARAKAEETLRFMQLHENWAYSMERCFPKLRPEMLGKLEVMVERWHINYSSTPGGGWCVVEWLHAKGDVDILSEGGGWRVCFDDRHPHHGKISIQAPTMAEAACLVSLSYCETVGARS